MVGRKPRAYNRILEYLGDSEIKGVDLPVSEKEMQLHTHK